MKKLFGLALIGLMAGTAGAATTTTTETAVGDPSVYGAVSVQKYDVTVKTTCSAFEIGCKSSSSTSSEFVATIDGDGATRLDAIKIPEDIAVASITYDRKFTLYFGKGFSTVTFPFSFKTECIDQTGYGDQKPFRFYKAVGVDGSSVVAEEETSEVSAHQPYIVRALLSGGSDGATHYAYINFKTGAGCSYTLKKNYDAETDKFVESKYSFDAGSLNGTWNFMGTYEKIQFTADTKAGVYGFASAEKKDDQGKVVVNAGSFVKAGDNASVPPMRAYLVYNKNGFNKEGKPSPDGETSVASISDEDLPEVITVKFIDKDENGNEEITAIAQMNTRTGEISTDKNLWFDLKGRKLNKKPTVKGTYYNNGQKVFIK